METNPNFRDLFVLLNEHEVEYLLVGSYALAFHGAPRYTGDMDIWVRPETDNAQRVLAALADFGFEFPNLTTDDFCRADSVVQLGYPPNRIDLMTSISGVTWDQADANRQAGPYGDLQVHYLSREDYITNKRASGRTKDLADLEALGEA
ncbi:MAG: hypothetical protein GVY16_02655 [Planctomycetes bacterium]|nr:hypothetical protein [Phycisphaerae bacterium]NBB94619.1 hypothetical protein [Planctomycetota bacterium]